MKNEAQLVAEVISSGQWSNKVIEKCGCKGMGWILHPCDVWMECPEHRGRKHPDDYSYDSLDDEEFDREYTNYIATELWNERYTDWSDQYVWDVAWDDFPF